MRKLIPRAIIPEDLYVERNADHQLRRNLSELGRPAYILVARQMGKTNLLLHARRKCATPEDAFVYADISKPFESAGECFRFIVDAALSQYRIGGCETDVAQLRSRDLPAYREYEESLRILLHYIKGRLVIILDEIDSLTKRSFSDTIFAQIRSSYFERASIPEFERLTYVLSGVLEPNSIIKDKRISPFNIGEEIYLEDFEADEIIEFMERAALKYPKEVVADLLEWTGGNPRMTWDLLSACEEKFDSNNIPSDAIETIAKQLYLERYDRAPVDHIRELVVADPELRDAVRVMQEGGDARLSDAVRRKLYLAGIVGLQGRESSPEIKGRILKEALPLEWLDNLQRAGRSKLKIAEAHFEAKEYDEALRMFEQAVDEGAVPPETVNLVCYSMGFAAYQLGSYRKAVTYLGAASISPRDNQLLYLKRCTFLGLSYYQLSQFDESIQSFREVVDFGRRDGISVRASVNLGGALLAKSGGRDIAEAMQVFRSGLAILDDETADVEEDERRLLRMLVYYNMAVLQQRGSVAIEEFLEKAIENSSPGNRHFVLAAKLRFTSDKQRRIELVREFVANVVSLDLSTTDAHPERPVALTQDRLSEVLLIAHRVCIDSFKELLSHLEKRENAGAASVASMLYLAAVRAIGEKDFATASDILELSVRKNGGTSKSMLRQSLVFWCLISSDETADRAYREYIEAVEAVGEAETPSEYDFQVFSKAVVHFLKGGDYEQAERLIRTFERLGRALPGDKHHLAAVLFWDLRLSEAMQFDAKVRGRAAELVDLVKTLDSEDADNSSRSDEIRFIQEYAFRTLGALDDLCGPDVVKRFNRNEKINVIYFDGRRCDGVKMKKVAADLESGRCHLLPSTGAVGL